MTTYFCKPDEIEKNALEQLRLFEDKGIDGISVFPDIHYCAEKNLPVGISFIMKDKFFPLITGKDLGCGVMYLKIKKEDYIKNFDKKVHYRAFDKFSYSMTDDGLGGGNHFLSLEEGDDDCMYIICHTGSRNLGIALYHKFAKMIDDFNHKESIDDSFLPVDILTEELVKYYYSVLDFATNRRKDFVMNTMMFLQQNGYVKSDTKNIKLVRTNFKDWDTVGMLNGTQYAIQDSIHNHLRFGEAVVHRKGSTELVRGKEVVIPLSMTRGSLIVKPGYDTESLNTSNWSCSHGAGRALSRTDAMKHWRSGMKESERKVYKNNFFELLDRSNEFPKGYVQEFDFAYKPSEDILRNQPYLIKVASTRPIMTVKFTEI